MYLHLFCLIYAADGKSSVIEILLISGSQAYTGAYKLQMGAHS
jgi:hypothetical protein